MVEVDGCFVDFSWAARGWKTTAEPQN